MPSISSTAASSTSLPGTTPKTRAGPGRTPRQRPRPATRTSPRRSPPIGPTSPSRCAGLVPGTAEILRALHARGVRLVALTNWSAETIHHGPEAFPEVFALFDDIVVSGAEGVAKPDREIFEILARRLGHPIDGVFYVDDNVRNVDAARAAGMDAVHFTDAGTLLEQLERRRLLD